MNCHRQRYIVASTEKVPSFHPHQRSDEDAQVFPMGVGIHGGLHATFLGHRKSKIGHRA
jgi:hypothetical protein